MGKDRAIKIIQRQGLLLVFPINNRPQPPSLWSQMHPGVRLRWEWSDDGDDKVARMWNLMKELSSGGEVVYSKWYQGRATFFSRSVFTSMLALMNRAGQPLKRLSPVSRQILELLRLDSPLSTKQIKEHLDLKGRLNEPVYNRAMKELFLSLSVVAYGEVDDGAFPSLAVGSTKSIYEDLWHEARHLEVADILERLRVPMPPGSLFERYFAKSIVDFQQQSIRQR